MGRTPQHIYTTPTSCAILPTMPCVCCVHRRVVEDSGQGSAGCVVHVDVHGERVMLWVAAIVVITEHGRYSLSCMEEL